MSRIGGRVASPKLLQLPVIMSSAEVAAARHIQSRIRGKQTRGQLGQLKRLHSELLGLYAVQIQAVIRGKLVRRGPRDGRLQPSSLVASQSQPNVRSLVASSSAPSPNERANAAQAAQAQAQAQAHAAVEAAGRDEAARCIQTAKRGADARSLAGRRRLHIQLQQQSERDAAAVAVQRAHRGSTARATVADMRAERADAVRGAAAVSIQKKARRRATRQQLPGVGVRKLFWLEANGTAPLLAAWREQPGGVGLGLGLSETRKKQNGPAGGRGGADVSAAMEARRRALDVAEGELAGLGGSDAQYYLSSAPSDAFDSLGLGGDSVYVPALALQHPHLFSQARRMAVAASSQALRPTSGHLGAQCVTRDIRKGCRAACLLDCPPARPSRTRLNPLCASPPNLAEPFSQRGIGTPSVSSFGGRTGDEAREAVQAVLALQSAQAEVAASLPVKEAVPLELLLRRKDDAMLSFLRESAAFESAQQLLGQNGHDPTVDILGAQVEAHRRNYSQAIAQLSQVAAAVLPAEEMQRLRDLHVDLERAMRTSLQWQEARRSSRNARSPGSLWSTKEGASS
ncbi:hypothetical protein T492DRAFT_1138661 [Pavlovales sp. CCMP2436]|nr:hypothetical protein T492DRAFT_1138661 [Pavlovales sp. CCMP2436]